MNSLRIDSNYNEGDIRELVLDWFFVKGVSLDKLSEYSNKPISTIVTWIRERELGIG